MDAVGVAVPEHEDGLIDRDRSEEAGIGVGEGGDAERHLTFIVGGLHSHNPHQAVVGGHEHHPASSRVRPLEADDDAEALTEGDPERFGDLHPRRHRLPVDLLFDLGGCFAFVEHLPESPGPGEYRVDGRLGAVCQPDGDLAVAVCAGVADVDPTVLRGAGVAAVQTCVEVKVAGPVAPSLVGEHVDEQARIGTSVGFARTHGGGRRPADQQRIGRQAQLQTHRFDSCHLEDARQEQSHVVAGHRGMRVETTGGSRTHHLELGQDRYVPACGGAQRRHVLERLLDRCRQGCPGEFQHSHEEMRHVCAFDHVVRAEDCR